MLVVLNARLCTLWALLTALLFVGAPPVRAAAAVKRDFSEGQIDNGEALSELSKEALQSSQQLHKRLVARGANSGCTVDKIRIRREWRTLPKSERRAFIAAVKCLQSSPSLLDPAVVPAAKTLWDDFVAIHLFQTGNIHLTATFLTWHRYFTWTYEQKLRDVCGYKGTFPYWEWGLDVHNPAGSPVFDGSDTSLSGNGAYSPHEGLWITQAFSGNVLKMQPGTGSGCVTSGPFKDLKVRLGTVVMPQYGSPNWTGSANPLGEGNERCLKRDLNAWVASTFTSFRNTTELILENNNVEMFQAIMQADDRYVVGQLGVHGGGHYTIGGDPGADPFISPGDPGFYLHHAQIDRVFWIWQMLDFQHRQGVWGTSTLQNMPPSPNVTVEDTVDISPLNGPVKIKDLMNTVGGSPFCYVYL